MSRRSSSSFRTAVRLVEGAVVVGVLALVAVFAVGGLVLHLGLSPVLTGSMRPTFNPGDAVVTRPVDVRSLRPGDVAVFVPPGENASYAHRITAVETDRTGHTVILTKGDANPAPDRWRATLSGPEVSKVVGTVPYVGRGMVWLGTPLIRAIGIAVLGLLITALGARALLSSSTPPRRALSAR